jgi:hypothetical protein
MQVLKDETTASEWNLQEPVALVWLPVHFGNR